MEKPLCSEEFRDHCIGVAYDEAHVIAQWYGIYIDYQINTDYKGLIVDTKVGIHISP